MTEPPGDPHCDLCEAARMTEWYFEDDVCWIAECEFCAVPMVVWKVHDSSPTDVVKADLHAKLGTVVAERFGFEFYVDDNMRNIPDHYHAHARPRRGPAGFAAGGGARARGPAAPEGVGRSSAPNADQDLGRGAYA